MKSIEPDAENDSHLCSRSHLSLPTYPEGTPQSRRSLRPCWGRARLGALVWVGIKTRRFEHRLLLQSDKCLNT
jgi:hypothetical protein